MKRPDLILPDHVLEVILNLTIFILDVEFFLQMAIDSIVLRGIEWATAKLEI
jgi:hypothetical protein